jgi:hypothetical protein
MAYGSMTLGTSLPWKRTSFSELMPLTWSIFGTPQTILCWLCIYRFPFKSLQQPEGFSKDQFNGNPNLSFPNLVLVKDSITI